LGIAPLFEHLKENIYKYGTTNEIRTFNNIQWWFFIILRGVEALREKHDVDYEDIMDASQNFDSMLDALKDPSQLYDYIE